MLPFWWSNHEVLCSAYQKCYTVPTHVITPSPGHVFWSFDFTVGANWNSDIKTNIALWLFPTQRFPCFAVNKNFKRSRSRWVVVLHMMMSNKLISPEDRWVFLMSLDVPEYSSKMVESYLKLSRGSGTLMTSLIQSDLINPYISVPWQFCTD